MRRWFVFAASIGAVLWAACVSAAAPVSDITNTRHNFSATFRLLAYAPRWHRTACLRQRGVADCVFCHTPHGARRSRTHRCGIVSSQATYIPFSSTSIDATDLGQPTGRSKLCLSCHDGTIALGAVNVLNRTNRPRWPHGSFTTTNSSPGTMPQGHGTQTGFTRHLGVDLSNDHPISFTYDSAQAARDGELFDPNSVPWIDERTRRIDGEARQPLPRGQFLPLERDADGVGPKVECITCHDPHVRSQVPGENIVPAREPPPAATAGAGPLMPSATSSACLS